MGKACSWLTRTIDPSSLSMCSGHFPGCLWCRGRSQPHTVPQLDFTLLSHKATGKEVHTGHAVCQKSLKTTLSHPCEYSNSFLYLKATSVCPGHVGSCIPQHRHILNTLCPLQVSRTSQASPLAIVHPQHNIGRKIPL